MKIFKSNIYFIFCFITLSCFYAYGQEQLVIINDSTQKHSFNTVRLNQLVNNDSLYKATTLLNDAINFSKKHNLKSTQARAYYSLGQIMTKMSSYKNSENYHFKALDIYKSLNDDNGKSATLAGLVKNFLSEKNYRNFDSIYPEAQKIARELKNEYYFFNLESKIKRLYYTNQNESLLEFSTFAVDTLKQLDISDVNFTDTDHKKIIQKKLLSSYEFYNAIANIKNANFNAYGYKLLFELDEETLKNAFETDADAYRKLATFNYYKYLYFYETKKNLDSASKYLLKSDSYKYDAIVNYERINSRDGELIYKIITTEQELNLANEIRKKDYKASRIYLITAVLTATLLIASLVMFYFYFKTRKNLQTINNKLKTTNDQLVKVDKSRLEFFSILSHELRTPIYGITGLATLAKQEQEEPLRMSYLNSLISSSNYLSILIDNILQANKLKFEEKKLRLKPDKIYKIIDYVLDTVKVAADNKGLQLTTNIQPSDENELVLIDKVAFSQIIINLVYNAIRYTTKGHVNIAVKEKSRTPKNVTLRFEIKDTGIGIKETDRHIVFSAFENRAFLHKNSSGSGLGLYIVKTLLKSHDSDIDFESDPDKGTTFFFEITFDIVISTNLKEPSMTKYLDKNMHVLIVDDNRINLLITKKNIEKIDGFTCEIVSNGKEAISLIKNKVFDLILMDINMPDMDGFEVTKHIRIFNPTIPILALTALNSSEISNKAIEAGMNQIITKPYLFEDFKIIIFSLLKEMDA